MSMNVQLFLDRSATNFHDQSSKSFYTNLDEITGKVVLRTTSASNISTITVKLEAESRTRLINQGRPGTNDKPKPVLEVHKLLYKVDTVFPPREIAGDPRAPVRSFTVLPGIHEYPFFFKIPFNNACQSTNSLRTNANFMNMSVEFAQTPKSHVKTTLPPTLYFPGEAEIRYYVKATVVRPQLLRENPRSIVNFNFFPIEPPRPANDGETYARRQHEFKSPFALANSPDGRRGTFPGLFKKSSTSDDSTNPLSDESPRFSIDARLPNPATITCSQTVPLRVIVTQLSSRDLPLYLQSLQVELIGYTYVRAHNVQRRESNSWVLCSKANMRVPLGNPDDPAGKEIEIPPENWQTHPLPSSVAPSFVTCNLRREYELEVRVGLAYGGEKSGQSVILPLRLPLKVFSGIRPPPELLKAMEATSEALPTAGSRVPEYRPTPTVPGSSQMADQPEPVAGSATQAAAAPAGSAPAYDEAPPSYEDAIASDMPAINGPRPNYEPPVAPGEESAVGLGDEKRPGRFGF